MTSLRTRLRKLFSCQTPRPTAQPACLRLDALEQREVPAVISASSGFSQVYQTQQIEIYSDNADGYVTVRKKGSFIEVHDWNNGFQRSLPAAGVQAVVFFGGASDDKVIHLVPGVQLRAYGFDGDDTLYGGNAGDILKGGDGDDVLVGRGGHDLLYGEKGNERLFGNKGNDYLNGGPGDDYFSGGPGTDTFRRSLFIEGQGFYATDPNTPIEEDVLADQPVLVSGPFLTDYVNSGTRDGKFHIDQDGSPTCAFLAALSAVAGRTGNSNDLVQSIRYDAATDQYGVTLFGTTRLLGYSLTVPQTVWVNGDWTEGRDPGGKLWVTLYQKAYLQLMGVTSRDEAGRALPERQWSAANTDWQDAGVAMKALTGRTASWVSMSSVTAESMDWQHESSSSMGMVALTKASGTSGGIQSNHAYMVDRVFENKGKQYVRLYNPWARDSRGGALFNLVNGVKHSKNDGWITLAWSRFTANFTGYYHAW